MPNQSRVKRRRNSSPSSDDSPVNLDETFYTLVANLKHLRTNAAEQNDQDVLVEGPSLDDVFAPISISTLEQLVTVDPQNVPSAYKTNSSSDSNGIHFEYKFYKDIRPGDKICARVKRAGVSGIMQVELVCMLSRFRRCLEFLAGKQFSLMFDRTMRVYETNDYVGVTVTSVNTKTGELGLLIDESEATIQPENLPTYFRESCHSNYEEDGRIARLCDNPNLAELLRVQIDSASSALPSLAAKDLQNPNKAAEYLRREQTRRLAMTHVVRGAELTRENKCFEATQCFNKALNVDDKCADAYVGRGAAAAGSSNYTAALSDLERALELQPTHKNALRYRVEVLLAFGRELVKAGNLAEAREKYEKVLDISDGSHSTAIEALKRLDVMQGRKQPELIDLSRDEMNGGSDLKRRQSMENVEQNRKKLREMEEFIENLKKKK